MDPFTGGVDGNKGIPSPLYFSCIAKCVIAIIRDSRAFRYVVLLSRTNALYDCADKKRETGVGKRMPWLLASLAKNDSEDMHLAFAHTIRSWFYGMHWPRRIYGTLHVEIPFPLSSNCTLSPLIFLIDDNLLLSNNNSRIHEKYIDANYHYFLSIQEKLNFRNE